MTFMQDYGVDSIEFFNSSNFNSINNGINEKLEVFESEIPPVDEMSGSNRVEIRYTRSDFPQ